MPDLGSPLFLLRPTRRQWMENVAGFWTPWVLTALGVWGAHLLIDEATRHERVLHLATIQALVYPVVLGYVVQLGAIRRFENLLRRMPWEELRLTLLTSRDLHEWAIRVYTRSHSLVLAILYPLVWAPIIWDAWEAVPRGPLLLLLCGGYAGSLLLLRFSVDLAFIQLASSVGYFRARLLALGKLVMYWFLLLAMAPLAWFFVDLALYMTVQRVYPMNLVTRAAPVVLWCWVGLAGLVALMLTRRMLHGIRKDSVKALEWVFAAED